MICLLYIESGELKGRKIELVPNANTRYTPGKVRLALVSMLDLKGKKVLELCAGSGVVGFEFLSNGASNVFFVDVSIRSIKTIEKNAKNLNVKDNIKVIKKDARIFLKSAKEKFDIVFMDPPFNLGIVNELLNFVGNVLKEDSILIVEHSKKEKLTPPDYLEVLSSKKYGDVLIDLFKLENIL
ncbi:16S rRNA (guanine(966)-N(2))-methyltransferase RsmD [Thermosipho sp. (in: thermotogales)]|uniref:16S rRNA (guanine(966)-N(2))-methyltransferase RsmD n=1 Tax=Thermosipho sp. (in: thermotogales) TaxID=1968895 RepID=UPI00257B643C|nr:16S rRNA (guanine(966)-N(2))-methyltransferase RsmD [Thermosipho sp. (in: thermotogales)]MBZ4650366.1 putative methyltransferase [Thermosipho sp. (in: thermotogales)]